MCSMCIYVTCILYHDMLVIIYPKNKIYHNTL